MEKIKPMQKWIPEIYLIASVIFYWVSTSNLWNPFAISLLVILATLFIWKTNVLGIAISVIFILLSIFMTLALISELREFPTFDNNAKTMLLVGAVWLTLNFLLSVMMMKKWFKEDVLIR